MLTTARNGSLLSLTQEQDVTFTPQDLIMIAEEEWGKILWRTSMGHGSSVHPVPSSSGTAWWVVNLRGLITFGDRLGDSLSHRWEEAP